MAKLRITYSKSAIGYSQDQKDTIRSLGLRRLNSVVVREDNPVIRGMVFKVQHLVTVEEVADGPPTTASTPAAKPTAQVSGQTPAAGSDPAGAGEAGGRGRME